MKQEIKLSTKRTYHIQIHSILKYFQSIIYI